MDPITRERTLGRITLLTREIQAGIILEHLSTGARLRLLYAMGRIHTQTLVFTETSRRIELGEGKPWAGRVGLCLKTIGQIALVYNVTTHTLEIAEAMKPYIRDMRRRCDNNGETALFLAEAVCSLTSDFFQYAQLAHLDLFFWDLLARFDGYSSSCL